MDISLSQTQEISTVPESPKINQDTTTAASIELPKPVQNDLSSFTQDDSSFVPPKLVITFNTLNQLEDIQTLQGLQTKSITHHDPLPTQDSTIQIDQ
ncbi:hypothetical protein BB560_005229, partial [Smittium megazygosporum]